MTDIRPLPAALAEQARPGRGDKSPPWVVLVCADFGFSSTAPEPLTIADWDAFLDRHEVVLRGTVLAGSRVSLMQHRVHSLADLAPAEIARSLPHLAGPVALRSTLTGLLDASVNRDDAVERLTLHAVDDELSAEAVTLLRTGPDALPRAALVEMLARVDGLLAEEASRCGRLPFVAARRAAWLALHELASAARRSSTISLLLCSETAPRLAERMGEVLLSCSQQGLIPDIILWDFPLRVTMPAMKQLAHLTAAAATQPAMLLAPIADDEPLLDALNSAEALRPLLADEQYVPLRRLRRNPASRCLGLCGPSAQLNADDAAPLSVSACWLIVQDTMRLLMDGASPLEVAVPSGEELERNYQYSLPDTNRISPDIAAEAGLAGLAVLAGASASGPRLPLVTAADRDVAGEGAGHFGFNLLLNRVERLCRLRLAEQEADGPAEKRAADLRQYLAGQLSHFRILTSERGVRVNTADGRLFSVDIDIDRNLGDFPIHLQVAA